MCRSKAVYQVRKSPPGNLKRDKNVWIYNPILLIDKSIVCSTWSFVSYFEIPQIIGKLAH